MIGAKTVKLPARAAAVRPPVARGRSTIVKAGGDQTPEERMAEVKEAKAKKKEAVHERRKEQGSAATEAQKKAGSGVLVTEKTGLDEVPDEAPGKK